MNHPDDINKDPGFIVDVPKLTDWEKEPTVSQLEYDLEMAKPLNQKTVQQIKEWRDLRNIEGKAKPKARKNRSQVQPKVVRRQNEWRYSALSEPFLSAEKMFKIRPKTWEDKKSAEQNSLVIEHQFENELDRVSFVDRMVRTAVDDGTVAVRLGWERETEIRDVEVPLYSFYPAPPDKIELIQQAAILMEEDPNGFADLPEDMQESARYSMENNIPALAVQVGTQIEQQEFIIRNRPTLDILHFENIFLDPTAEDDVKKANFAVISFETSEAELRKDGRYKNLDMVNWSSNSPLHHNDHHSNTDHTQPFKDRLRKRIVAYEYWGKRDLYGDGKLRPFVATFIGKTMIRMEENPFPDKEIPIVLIPYMPVRGSMTGEPDAALLEENQQVSGAVMRGMIDVMGRSANGQTAYAKGMLDPVNKRRLEAGEDYEFNPNIQPKVGIHHHVFPEIPASAMNMLALQNQDAEALTGVKAFTGGLSGEAYGEVAAGIRGMLDASSKREMSILRRLAAGVAEIGRKIISMNQSFLSEEEVVRITNDEFVTVRREDLAGNFDLKVDISTAEVDEAQAQDLAFMLQTMGNNMDFAMVQMVLAEIARLKKMPELAKKIEQFQPQPDPIDVEKRQLENQLLRIEIMERESKAILNRANARKVAAEADLKDLDFLETETGTKHARDVDKQQAQSEGNINLEIVKTLLNPPKQETVN